MKKILIATLITGLSTFANAGIGSDKGFYIQADVGISQLKVIAADDSIEIKDDVSTQRLTVGYDFERFKVGVDYTNYGKMNIESDCKYDCSDAGLKFKSIAVKGIYTFNHKGRVQPYIGGKLIHTKVKVDSDAPISIENKNTLGIGVLGGVEFKVNKNLFLNGNIEFNKLAVDVNQFGANAGVRYKFK